MKAFKALKKVFTSASLLCYFNENKLMRVKTDTFKFVIDRILTQQFKIDSHFYWLPVTYYSRKLLDTETQYDTDKQELLTIVEVMHHWQHYCQGAKYSIVILTDYANLVWFMIISNLTKRQLKWAEKLTEYDFNVTYWEGNKNSVNDLLRRSDYELLKAATTSTVTEIVWQSFHLRSENYKLMQKKLYTLTTMTLQSKHSVQKCTKRKCHIRLKHWKWCWYESQRHQKSTHSVVIICLNSKLCRIQCNKYS